MSNAASSAPPSAARKYMKVRETGAPMSTVSLVLVGFACGLVGLWAATQYTADYWGYDPRLSGALYPVAEVDELTSWALTGLCLFFAGVLAFRPGRRRAIPVFLLGSLIAWASTRGPLYSPTSIVQWMNLAQGDTSAAAVFHSAGTIGFGGFLGAILGAFIVFSGTRKKEASNSHGTAEFGSGIELAMSKEDEKLLVRTVSQGEMSPIKGQVLGRHQAVDRLLWYRGDSHILTMAPTRSGKGVGGVIPNLLFYRGSVLVSDIKGENFQVTHKRRDAMGQKVVALDPFGVTTRQGLDQHKYLASFNPMDMIDVVGPRRQFATDDAMQLASVLIDEGVGEAKHWAEEAKSLVAGLMLHIAVEAATSGSTCNLLEMRRIIRLPGEEFQEVLEQMQYSANEIVRGTAARLLQKDERERSGVISTVGSNTNFLDSASMQNVLSHSTFDLKAIKPNRSQGIEEQPMSIYLVIPPQYLTSHAPWLRLMIVSLIRVMTDTQEPPKDRVLFLLDEFANLGFMQAVVDGISLVAGYGLTFWVFVQDLAQLKATYKEKSDSIFANSDVKQCFGTNDYSTAELLSKMTGETTIFSESGSTTKGRNFGRQSSRSLNAGESVSEKGRKLLNPDEIMRMPPEEMLLFVKGSNPLIVEKLAYWRDREFNKPKKLWDDNPMYE